MRPETLTEVLDRIRKGEPRVIALCEFLDEFYTRPEDRPGMIAEDPGFLDDDIYDAWIGGVGEHLARRWKLRVPPWTENPRRFLKRPWFVNDAELLKPYLIAESPASFRRRLIFTELEPLRRATFPAGQEAKLAVWRAAASEPDHGP
jgi:hypothetical protein